MLETFEKAKELKSQIAFFVFLGIALLLSKLLMVSLSETKLAEPIELEYAGISVSMPTRLRTTSVSLITVGLFWMVVLKTS